MPLNYAIKEFVPQVGLSFRDSDIAYHPVPKHVAEANKEMGRVAVFNNNGEKVTEWMPLDVEVVERALQQKSLAASRKDRLGSELEVGDFVLYCEFDGTTLYVGQVAGFTSKSVRVITYIPFQSKIKMVEAKKITRIHPDIISQ